MNTPGSDTAGRPVEEVVTDWVIAVVGSLLVAVVMRDVFHTLFHPIGRGSIAPQLMKFVWWLLRLFRSGRRIPATWWGYLGRHPGLRRRPSAFQLKFLGRVLAQR